jgi:tetratricopeptide (TPR) repeat protein
MRNHAPRIRVLAILLCMFCFSCVTIKYGEDVADYSDDIAELQKKLLVNPKDANALRDLGVIYFQTRQYPRARDYLQRASQTEKEDAKTLFYLGMTLEFQGDREEALSKYIRYSDFSVLSPYRKLMEGRYRGLTLQIIREQFQELVVREDQIGDQPLSPTTVAVFPLTYQSGDAKFSSLGLGLSEMMIVDLGQVKRLRLVERIRIEALLAELRFGATRAVDPATAPRLGRFLSAGRIVGGSFSISPENALRLDVAFMDVANRKFPEPTTQSDALENLFKVEKDLVFGVIKQMGIPLTRAEREKIETVPTRNLQAFILYSIGLEKEGLGDFTAASVYFKQAVALDPNFGLAKNKADASESLSLAGGGKEQALAAAMQVEPGRESRRRKEPLNITRLNNLGTSIGSGFVPGQDDREPAEEAARSGAAVGRLPDPPKPPLK